MLGFRWEVALQPRSLQTIATRRCPIGSNLQTELPAGALGQAGINRPKSRDPPPPGTGGRAAWPAGPLGARRDGGEGSKTVTMKMQIKT